MSHHDDQVDALTYALRRRDSVPSTHVVTFEASEPIAVGWAVTLDGEGKVRPAGPRDPVVGHAVSVEGSIDAPPLHVNCRCAAPAPDPPATTRPPIVRRCSTCRTDAFWIPELVPGSPSLGIDAATYVKIAYHLAPCGLPCFACKDELAPFARSHGRANNCPRCGKVDPWAP